MGLDGLQNSGDIAQFGNRGDICALCLEAKVKEDKKGFAMARNELKGKLEGEKVIRAKDASSVVCICLKHIHEIAKNNPMPKAGGSNAKK